MKTRIFAAILAVVGAASAAHAGQLVLTPANVIGSSGEEYNSPGFAAGNIFDQQTGPVSDSFDENYWLNYDNGPADAFITISLGAPHSLNYAILFNTHNGPYGDRGTGNFTIVGGNAIQSDGDLGYVLSGPTTVLFSGTLTGAPVSDPIAGQLFFAKTYLDFQYLEFLPTSVASANPSCCGANVYGLNELRLYSAVPEPANWATMLIGFGALGTTMRRSRKRKALFRVQVCFV